MTNKTNEQTLTDDEIRHQWETRSSQLCPPGSLPHGFARAIERITLARVRLPAASEAEPVAWIEHHKGGDNLVWDNPGGKCSPLYAAPTIRNPLIPASEAGAVPQIVREAVEAAFEQRPGYLKLAAAAVRAMNSGCYALPNAAPPEKQTSHSEGDAVELLKKFMEFSDADYVPNSLFERAQQVIDAAPTVPHSLTVAQGDECPICKGSGEHRVTLAENFEELGDCLSCDGMGKIAKVAQGDERAVLQQVESFLIDMHTQPAVWTVGESARLLPIVQAALRDNLSGPITALRFIDSELSQYLEGMPNDTTSRRLRDVARAALSRQPSAGDAEDAQRYRFIRDVPHCDLVRSVLTCQQNAIMDEVIDAARALRAADQGGE